MSTCDQWERLCLLTFCAFWKIGVKDKDYFPVVLVANKCDLEYERQVGGHGTSLFYFFHFVELD